MDGFKDLRKGVQVNRNRDMSWVRTLDKKSAERRMGVWMQLAESTTGHVEGLQLTLTDEAGHTGTAQMAIAWQAPKDAAQAEDKLKSALGKLGDTLFEPLDVQLALPRTWFVPPSQLNALRREAVQALEEARALGLQRLPRAVRVEPPVAYPEDTLT
jgi:putative protease